MRVEFSRRSYDKNRKTNPWNQHRTYVIGLARNSCSTCRHCHDTISENSIRFGIIFEHSNGYMLLKWYHLKCIDPPQNVLKVDDLEGYELLDQQNQGKMMHWLSKTRAPTIKITPPVNQDSHITKFHSDLNPETGSHSNQICAM